MKTQVCILLILFHFKYFSQINFKIGSNAQNHSKESFLTQNTNNFISDSIERFDGKKVLFLRNRIHLDANLLGHGPSCLSYEYFLKSGLVGIQLPINLYSFYVEDKRSVVNTLGRTIGLALRFYFKENGNGLYFGPSFGIGTFVIKSVYVGPYGLITDFEKFRVYPLTFKFGYQIKIVPKFGFDLGLTGGVLLSSKGIDNFAGANAGINFSF